MGRKIGNFADPHTNESHYMDTGNLPKLALIPSSVVRFKDSKNTLITFSLEENEQEKAVMLFGEYEYRNKTIVSDAIFINEEEFARELFEYVYADESIDNSPILIEAKRLAVKSLGEKLLKEGTLIDSSVIEGIGFVRSNGQRMMTIEKLEVQVYQNGTARITLRDCVSNALLKDIVDPVIEFLFDSNKIVINKFSINKETGNLIKDCEIDISNFVFEPNEENIEYEKIAFDIKNASSVEKFVLARRAFLDYTTTVDNNLNEEIDSRFADIF